MLLVDSFDGDVKTYNLPKQEVTDKKNIHLPKVPDYWSVGFVLSLYYDGFTVRFDPGSKLSTEKISYEECDFLRFIDDGLIPDILVPLLPDITMVAENKMVVEVCDYRGYPRHGLDHYILDHPILTKHVLKRSVQSLVLELYDVLGDRLTVSQLQHLENYLLMVNMPPLCLDPSTEVFYVKSTVHTNQNVLNERKVRALIQRIMRSSDHTTAISDMVYEMLEILELENKDKHPAREVSETTTTPAIPHQTAPNMAAEILELCLKRTRIQMIRPADQIVARQMNTPQSVESDHVAAEVSPVGYTVTPGPPQLKPAPFMTNNKGTIMTGPKPISPNVAGQIMTPTSGAITPSGTISPSAGAIAAVAIQPSNIATVNRMPNDALAMSKGSPYTTQYAVSSQQQLNKPPITSQVAGMGGMMGMGPVQQPILRASGNQMMLPQHHVPPGQGQMVQKQLGADGITQLNKPLANPGLMIPQQYQRNYQYHSVAPIPRGYVEQNQYIPVQPGRAGQVLQISLPPNMNPHQPTVSPLQPRPQSVIGPNMPSVALPSNMAPGSLPVNIPPQPLHGIPYNQMQIGGLQSQNMYNQYG